MHVLNEQSRKSILHNTGLTVEEISSMSLEEAELELEQKIGKKLFFRISKNPLLVGRGSVYLDLGRLMPIQKIERLLSRI
jgi:hypothetical protein